MIGGRSGERPNRPGPRYWRRVDARLKPKRRGEGPRGSVRHSICPAWFVCWHPSESVTFSFHTASRMRRPLGPLFRKCAIDARSSDAKLAGDG
jgi:hypothetical protein